ncbi:hypothetical protein LCGC14_0543550 [marine sediment metagenome]|uniref:CopG family transcriptional regulator n=1 Tax=marine sediment metagenome TaxID=412755 RepID=A0A0F9UDD0_9ZZZZ
MPKVTMKTMPVITIHMYPSDKNNLDDFAKAKGMKLATYCRMILLEKLKER